MSSICSSISFLKKPPEISTAVRHERKTSKCLNAGSVGSDSPAFLPRWIQAERKETENGFDSSSLLEVWSWGQEMC
ncbi:uncharacterized [Tachysurus ichikawai]